MAHSSRSRSGRGQPGQPDARHQQPGGSALTQVIREFGDRWNISVRHKAVLAVNRADPSVVLTAATPDGIRELITGWERPRLVAPAVPRDRRRSRRQHRSGQTQPRKRPRR